MRFLTDRKRALGQGASGQGTEHHWKMMVRSVAMAILVPLFVITFGAGLGGSFEEVQAYFGRPFPAIVTGLTLIVGIQHFLAEVHEAVEDYMHGVAEKLTIMATSFFAYTLIAAGLYALAKLAL